MAHDDLERATVEHGGWRYELAGIETFGEFPTHSGSHLEISGHVVSAEPIDDAEADDE